MTKTNLKNKNFKLKSTTKLMTSIKRRGENYIYIV